MRHDPTTDLLPRPDGPTRHRILLAVAATVAMVGGCGLAAADRDDEASGGAEASSATESSAADATATDVTVVEPGEDHDESVPHTHATDDPTEVTTTESPTTENTTTGASAATAGDLLGYLEAYDAANDNVTITWTDDTLTIAGNGMPDFETGTFPGPGNPNAISAQDVSYSITLDPVYTGTPTAVKEPGTSVGGIKFDPGTAERDAETGASIEAFNSIMDLGLDVNNAHVQPDGSYHFHGVPDPLTASDGSEHSALVGFMHDGFPVYSLYGYGAADTADGTVSEMTSSWQTQEGERAADEPDGSYDGTYTLDFEYVAGSGDLDECNGMFTVTPEYPDGTYAYFITDTFPYISRCLMGEVSDAALAGPVGGAPPTGRSGPPGGTSTGAPLSTEPSS